MTPEQNLILAAARLSRASPESWDEFLSTFTRYAWDMAEKLVQSPVEVVLVAQGRAQGMMILGKLLTDCQKTASSMEANKQKD